MPPSRQRAVTDFDVWGSRGSCSLVPRRSRIGNNTSCYSVLRGEDLVVLDAGRGLAFLGYAMRTQARFRRVGRIHLLLTHAHMDHWEGLKDVEWFWRRGNGLEVTLHATPEALAAIAAGFEHPLYVPLDRLAEGTVGSLSRVPLRSGDRREIGPFSLRTFPLNHYSGAGATRRPLDTVGFRLAANGGPTITYLSDHQPTETTQGVEADATEGAHVAVYDAHFADIRDQGYGHGSQEYAASVARRSPETLVLAAHHGPNATDDSIREAHRRHSRGLKNFHLAVEGRSYRWDGRARFVRHGVAGV